MRDLFPIAILMPQIRFSRLFQTDILVHWTLIRDVFPFIVEDTDLLRVRVNDRLRLRNARFYQRGINVRGNQNVTGTQIFLIT